MASVGVARPAVSSPAKGKCHVFLTGAPGTGKTTAIRRVVDLIGGQAPAGLAVDGFYTEERRRVGRDGRNNRTGFDIVTLGGVRESLADLSEPGPSGRRSVARIGRYDVRTDKFPQVVMPVLRSCLERSSQGQPQIVVIDEIGKMEAFSRDFLQAVTGMLRQPQPLNTRILGTIPSPEGTYQGQLKEVLHQIRSHPHCTVVAVSRENRSAVPATVMDLLFSSNEQ